MTGSVMYPLFAIGGWGQGTTMPPLSAGTAMVSAAVAVFVVFLCGRAGRKLSRPRSSRLASGDWIMLLALTLAAPAGAAAQDAPPALPAPAASPTPETPASEPARLQIGGSVDGVYAYNFNRPADHANFLPGLGTSAKRDNELTLNLAQVDLVLAPAPVGFKLSLGFGTATEVVHAAEVRGVATSPDVWRNVLQASVQWQTGVGRGLVLEGGVLPCHVGFEGFAPKDNWNYTRSWLGELSPYYQAGLKAAYPLSDRWSAQLHLLNGWQVIGDNNRGKTLGTQVAYSADKFSASVNTMIGPELAGNDDDLRVLGDVVMTWKTTPSLSIGASVDVAREGRPVGDNAAWFGAGLYARIAPPSSRTALALRAEYYNDEDGAISGLGQTLKEVTATLEHRPAPRLILRLEGRYDRSSALAFADDALDPDGAPFRKRNQFLLLLGAIATF